MMRFNPNRAPVLPSPPFCVIPSASYDANLRQSVARTFFHFITFYYVPFILKSLITQSEYDVYSEEAGGTMG
jgi:hypothetical protein